MSRRLRELAEDVASRRGMAKPGEARRLARALVKVHECLDEMDRCNPTGEDPAAAAIRAVMSRP